MSKRSHWKLTALIVWLIAAGSGADAASESEVTHSQLLPGDRVLLGTVEEVASDQARIDTGELQPRFIPMNVRRAKGLADLKKGNRVEVTLNGQNLLVDVHLARREEPPSHHSWAARRTA